MLTGVILAGGANRRMKGESKALLPFGGQPLVVRQVDRMRILCDEVIVVTNDPRPYLPILDRSVRIITDFFAGHGPLGGMHAALSLAKHTSVWVVGCDMPFVSSKAAELLWNRKRDGFEAVVPLWRADYFLYMAFMTGNAIPRLFRFWIKERPRCPLYWVLFSGVSWQIDFYRKMESI